MKDASDLGSKRRAPVPCAESQSLKRSEKEGTQKNTLMLKMIFNTSFKDVALNSLIDQKLTSVPDSKQIFQRVLL